MNKLLKRFPWTESKPPYRKVKKINIGLNIEISFYQHCSTKTIFYRKFYKHNIDKKDRNIDKFINTYENFEIDNIDISNFDTAI